MALAGCQEDLPAGVDPAQVDAVEAPELGACRDLTVKDVAAPSNATKVVDCGEEHTAKTYAVGSIPAELTTRSTTPRSWGVRVQGLLCEVHEVRRGRREPRDAHDPDLGVVPSVASRRGTRGRGGIRCDVVGGGDQTKELVDLPSNLKGLLLRPDDEWLVCAQGPTVDGSVKVPCSVRARLAGRLDDQARRDRRTPTPATRVSEVTTRDYCSKSVGAWLNYPVDYDFGYTWFHEPEWNAGNRRSVCWAKTSQ